MPTYDYRGHEFEKFQSIKAPSIRKCPQCGKLKVKRLLGAGAGILFKGNGFYQTDYRSDSYRKAAEEDTPAGGAAGKSEGKPADKKSSDTSGDKAAASSGND